MPTDDSLLTTSEVGKAIGRNVRAVQRMAESGELPFERKLTGPNGAYLFRRSDVDHYLREHQADVA